MLLSQLLEAGEGFWGFVGLGLCGGFGFVFRGRIYPEGAALGGGVWDPVVALGDFDLNEEV